MKRDMDLIRDILVAVNDNPKCDGVMYQYFTTAEELGIRDHSTEEVAYHVLLLIEAGFIHGELQEQSPIPSIKGLTWNGHEFLGSISDPGIWAKTKERLVGLSSVTISVVAELAKAELKKHLALP